MPGSTARLDAPWYLPLFDCPEGLLCLSPFSVRPLSSCPCLSRISCFRLRLSPWPCLPLSFAKYHIMPLLYHVDPNPLFCGSQTLTWPTPICTCINLSWWSYLRLADLIQSNHHLVLHILRAYFNESRHPPQIWNLHISSEFRYHGFPHLCPLHDCLPHLTRVFGWLCVHALTLHPEYDSQCSRAVVCVESCRRIHSIQSRHASTLQSS